SAVTAPDPSTVVVALPKPFSPGAFLSIMANPGARIVDSATVKADVVNNEWGNGWLTDHSAGSGPFQLARWERQVAIELVENPRYNLGPAPQVKRIIFPNILENTVQREMLGRGDADVAWNLSAAQLAAVRSDPRLYVVQTPDLAMEYLGMDVKNVPAFAKAEVRRAVKYAIDYDGIINDLLNGNGTPLQGVIPKGLFGYEPTLWFKHDPAKAKSLLAEAGVGAGFTAELLTSTGPAAGGISSGDLAAKVKNDPVVKLVGQAAEMQNTPERGAIYTKVNETMAQDGPFAILYQPVLSLAVSKRLQNFLFDPVNFIDFLSLTKH